MNNGQVGVNAAILSQSSNELKQVIARIPEIKERLNSYLSSCQNDFQASGLDQSVVAASFEKLLGELETRLSNYNNYIDTTVIPSYERLNNSLVKMFNSDFATEMNSLMSSMKV